MLTGIQTGNAPEFAVGDTFVGNDEPGQIVEMDSTGSSVWLTLPSAGDVASVTPIGAGGALAGDLLATTFNTEAGNNYGVGAYGISEFYLVDPKGNYARLNVPEQYLLNTAFQVPAGDTPITQPQPSVVEAVSVPDQPVRWGPLAGSVLFTSENDPGVFFDISLPPLASDLSQLTVTPYYVGDSVWNSMVEIPNDQNLYLSASAGTIGGVAPGSPGAIYEAPASDFSGMVGGILLTENSDFPDGMFEPPHTPEYTGSPISLLTWSQGAGLQLTPLTVRGATFTDGFVYQAVFSTADFITGQPTTLPLADRTIELHHDGDPTSGSDNTDSDLFAVTDANGDYSFQNLSPGTYTVQQILPSGWTETDPSSGGYTVTIGLENYLGTVNAGPVLNLDFGSCPTPLAPPSQPAPPEITSTPTHFATEGQTYTYNFTVSNPNPSDTLLFDLPQQPAGMSVEPTGSSEGGSLVYGSISWTLPLTAPDIDDALLRVTDAVTGAYALQPISIALTEPAPTNLQVSTAGVYAINLSWNEVPSATEYLYARSTNSNFSDVDPDPMDAATGALNQGWYIASDLDQLPSGVIYCVDESLTPATTYYYEVAAVTNRDPAPQFIDNGEGGLVEFDPQLSRIVSSPSTSSANNATTLPSDESDSVLAAPAGLTATPTQYKGATAIALEWEPILDPYDPSDEETNWRIQYDIYRSQTDDETTAPLIGTVDPFGTSFTNCGLTVGITYYYWVKGVNTTNGLDVISGYSNEATATTTNDTPTIVLGSSSIQYTTGGISMSPQGYDSTTGDSLPTTSESYGWQVVQTPTGGQVKLADETVLDPSQVYSLYNPSFYFTEFGTYVLQVRAQDSFGYSAWVQDEIQYTQTLNNVRLFPGDMPSLGNESAGTLETGPTITPGSVQIFDILGYDQEYNPVPLNVSEVSLRFGQNDSGAKAYLGQVTDAGVSYPYLEYVAGSKTGTDKITVYVEVGGNEELETVSMAVVNTQYSAPVLSAAPISEDQVQLSWNTVAGDPMGYELLRTGSDGSITILPGLIIDTVHAVAEIGYKSETSYTDADLNPNTTYTYEVEAVDSDFDTGAISAPVSVTTWAAPAPPTDVQATALSPSSVQITWDPDQANDPNIVSWMVLRSDLEDGTYTPLPNPLNGSQYITTPGSYLDNSVNANETYWYEVEAVQDTEPDEQPTDVSAASASVTVTVPAGPPQPQNVIAGYAGDDRVGIQWNKVTYDSSLLLGYDIYRGTTADFPLNAATLIGSSVPSRAFYTDDGVLDSYYYRVVAVALDGNGGEVDSPASSAVFVDITAAVTAPAAPSSLAGIVSGNSVTLNWTDNSANEAGFEIFRIASSDSNSNTPSDSTWTLVGAVTQDATQFVDTPPTPGSYVYAVRGYSISNGVGVDLTDGFSAGSPIYGGFSNVTPSQDTSSGTAPDAPSGLSATPVTYNSVTLGWTSGGSTVSSYSVWRGLADSAIPTATFEYLGSTTSNSFSDDTVNSSTAYIYEVAAIGTNGSTSAPASLNVTTDAPGSGDAQVVVQISGLDPEITETTPTDWNESIPQSITGPENIWGVVTPYVPETAISWTLSLQAVGTAEAESSAPIIIRTGTGPIGAISQDAVLGTVDPSRVPAGSYQIVLSAQVTGNSTVWSATYAPILAIAGPAQLGNLTLPVTDLTVNVPGQQPIVIQRNYDSSQTNVPSNLGPGWSFDIVSAKISTTATGTGSGLQFGDLVYITLPDGEQHVFQFFPIPDRYDQSVSGTQLSTDPLSTESYLNASYTPQFICVDGSGAKLIVPIPDDGLTYESDTGDFDESLTSEPYNPVTFGDTYTLTESNGSSYTMKADSGLIQTYTDANGNTTTYSFTSSQSGGTITSGSTTVTFFANGSGKITLAQVSVNSDTSDDISVQYTYTSGTLTSVSTPTLGNASPVTAYTYGYDSTSSKLNLITNGINVPVLTATYDSATGDLSSLTNALSNTASVQNGDATSVSPSEGASTPYHASTPTTPVITSTSTEDVYDAQGNVTREIQTVFDSSGSVIEYIITCHSYAYGGLDIENSGTNDLTEGVTSDNQLTTQTDYQPFVIMGSDPDNFRYTENATQVASVTTYYGTNGVPIGDVGQIEYVTVYGANNVAETTTYADYVDGQPETISDPNDNVTTNTYDSSGNLTSTIAPNGAYTTNSYTTSADEEYGVPAGLLISTEQYASEGGTLISTSTNQYYADVPSNSTYFIVPSGTDVPGELAATVNAAGVTNSYQYDAQGNQLSDSYQWVNPSNTSETETVSTVNTYDAMGRVTSTTAGIVVNNSNSVLIPGTISQTNYNAIGQVTSTATQTGFDSDNNPIFDTTSNYYDLNGNLVETVNSNGTVTRTAYDALNRPYLTMDSFTAGGSSPQTATAPDDIDGTLTLYDALGRTIGTERVSGVQINDTIDPTTGIATASVWYSLGTQLSASATTYNPDGTVASTTTGTQLTSLAATYNSDGSVSIATDGSGQTTAYTYNPDGTKASETQLNVPVWDVATNETANQNLTTFYTYDLGGRLVTQTDPRGLVTVYQYNAAGQATSTLNGGDPPITDTYDSQGNKLSETDQNGNTTYYHYDNSGNLIEVIQPAVEYDVPGSGNESVYPVAKYAYDSYGNETSQTTNQYLTSPTSTTLHGTANTTTYAYDALGHMVSETLPDGQPESWTYNNMGQLSVHTDFDGNTATYTYYTTNGSGAYAGQVEQIVYAGNGLTTQTVAYTYDAMGRLATVTDASGTTSNTYDNQGNFIESLTPEGTIHYVFNALNQHIETWTGTGSDPSTATTRTDYAYDALGRLTTVTVLRLNGATLSTPLVTSYAYDADNNLVNEQLPNGVTMNYSYNHLNYLTDLVETNSAGLTLLSEHYTLNPNGADASVDEPQLQTSGSTVRTQTVWTYDADGRLTSVVETNAPSGTLVYSDAYTYDLGGNRLSDTHVSTSGTETTTYTYNGNDQLTEQVDSVSGTTMFYYDANGSQTSTVQTPLSGSAVTTTYAYDVRNRMSSVTSGGGTTYYVYDDDGNRVQETTGSTTTYYLIDKNNPTGYDQPIEQRTSTTGVPTESYIIGTRVLGQIGSATGAAVTWLLTDGHGSTTLLTDASGNVTADFNYDAFGGAIGSWSPTTAGTIFLFGGDAVYDAASGLYLHGDGIRPTQGFRFTQMDTYAGDNGDPLSLNKYLYAGANPVMYNDPSGHDWSLAGLTVGLGIQAGLIGLSVPVLAGITSHESGGSFGVGFYNSLFAGAAFFFITAKDGGVESPKFWTDVTSVLVQTTMGVGLEWLRVWSRDPGNVASNFGPQEVNDTFWKNFNTFAESTAYNIGYDSPLNAAIATAATSFIQKSPDLIASVSHNLYGIFTNQPTDWENTGKLFVSDTMDAIFSGYKSFVNNGLPEINDLPEPIKSLAKSAIWGGVDSLRKAISKL